MSDWKKFEHKVVVVCVIGAHQADEAQKLQQALDQHREWQLVSVAVCGGGTFTLFFSRGLLRRREV